MSRCCAYPPPGYQKKAQQPAPDVTVTAKVVQKEKSKTREREREKEKRVKDSEKDKEKKDRDKKDKEKRDKEKDKERDKEKKDKDKSKDKDKDKDKERRDKDKRDKDKEKREKRKKDGETNGAPHDKDPRSSKLHRTSLVNDVVHSNEENGRVHETKTTTSVARPLDRDGRDAAKPRGSIGGPATRPPSMYITKEQEANGKVDPTLPPVVLSKPVCGGQTHVEATPASRPSNHNHHIESNNVGSQRHQKLPDFSICDTLPQHTSWSAIDDEDWLSPSNERIHPRPKAEVEDATSQQVWADTVYLPSVDMYALPYVVPY